MAEDYAVIRANVEKLVAAGATPEDIEAYVAHASGQFLERPNAPVPQPAADIAPQRSIVDALAQGATDTAIGLGHMGIGLREAVGIPSSVSSQQAAEIQRKRNAEIEASRGPAAGSLDWARIGGAAASTLPLALLPGGPLVQGAVAGMSQPVEGEDALGKEKLTQALLGSGGALLGTLAGKGAGSLLSGRTGGMGANAKLLADEGVQLTPGQIAGPAARKFESAWSSVPFVGDAIRGADRTATESLNAAAYNRALGPVGQKWSGGVDEIGHQGVEQVRRALSAEYDNIVPQLRFVSDDTFTAQIDSVLTQARDVLAPAKYDQLVGQLRGSIMKSSDMSGDAVKSAQEQLRGRISTYSRSTDADSRFIEEALRGARDAFNEGLMRANPQLAERLAAIDRGWRNFAVIRKGSGGVGADEGVMSPAQLHSAVHATDTSRHHGRFAEGGAMMQDLSGAAKSVMAQLPNSGTADRLSSQSLLGLAQGALAYAPVRTLYSDTGRQMLEALLLRRPELMRQLGMATQQAAPALGPAQAPLLQALLQGQNGNVP